MMNTTPDGILVLNKAAGMTSHDVVNRVRRLYGTKQVGHTGTLDPMATGILVVLVGRTVKASDFAMANRKRYRAGLLLGVTTDTEDTTGSVLTTSPLRPEPSAVEAALSAFRGKIMQIPPMVSAIKKDGRKLCDLARQGIEIEREPREIEIFSLTVTPDCPAEGRYFLDVSCSKGTYIRTLCADIGRSLGCGGAMSSLCRTENGAFTLSSAVTLDALDSLSLPERIALLQPCENLFSDLPLITLPPFFARLCHCGCEIYQSKIQTSYPSSALVRLADSSGFFALGEVRDFPAGSAIKPIRQFRENALSEESCAKT